MDVVGSIALCVSVLMLVLGGWCLHRHCERNTVGRATTLLITGFLVAVFAAGLLYGTGVERGHDIWVGFPWGQYALEEGSTHDVIAQYKVEGDYMDRNLVVIRGGGKTIRICAVDQPLPPECRQVKVVRHGAGFRYLIAVQK